jgi:hypothetical protein
VHRRIALSAERRVDPARPARHGVLLNVLPDNGLTEEDGPTEAIGDSAQQRRARWS